MKAKKLLRVVILLSLTQLLAGCASKLVLYPISQQDIYRIEKGQVFTAEKDGYFLSDFYMQEVLEAKVK